MRKKIPSSLPFEERKRLLINCQEAGSKVYQQNPHLKEEDITKSNIDNEIDNIAVCVGMELQQRFEAIKTQKAFSEGLCEVILDTGNIKYRK